MYVCVFSVLILTKEKVYGLGLYNSHYWKYFDSLSPLIILLLDEDEQNYARPNHCYAIVDKKAECIRLVLYMTIKY